MTACHTISAFTAAQRLSLAAVLAGFLMASQVCAQTSVQPLVQQADFVYLGAFRLPEVPYGGGHGATYGFDYASSGFAYNPANNSLLINNHIYEQKTAEVSIPELSTDLKNLAVAEFLQDFSDITEGNLGKIGEDGSDYGSTVNIGGLLVYKDKLIGTAYAYYDAAYSAKLSHFTSNLALSQSGDFSGMRRVGDVNPGFVGGYLAEIPQEWRAALGGPVLTGQCCIPIISRSSFGPAAFVFDPDDLDRPNPAPAGPLVYYDSAHPTLGEWGNTTVQNLYYNMATSVNGAIFPAGTSSLLFFGAQGTGVPCYGEGGATEPAGAGHWCYDPVNGSKGCHAYPYQYWVWAYDANELLKVKRGSKNPWEVVPYAVWPLELPFATGSAQIQGAAYDPKTQRLFISQMGADGNIPGAGPYDRAPVIQVFKIDAAPPVPDLTGLVPPKARLAVKRRKLEVIMTAPSGISGVSYQLQIRVLRGDDSGGRRRRINRSKDSERTRVWIGKLKANDRVVVRYRYQGWGQLSELSPPARKRMRGRQTEAA